MRGLSSTFFFEMLAVLSLVYIEHDWLDVFLFEDPANTASFCPPILTLVPGVFLEPPRAPRFDVLPDFFR